jgi:hypothetical protein
MCPKLEPEELLLLREYLDVLLRVGLEVKHAMELG